MPIGILDSGVGGLTVWREIVRRLPEQSTIYLGDSKNCPYGTKTEEAIWDLTKNMVEFLLAKQVSLIVLACNTISVTTLERLRQVYPNVSFIGTVPAVKTAVVSSKSQRIGILSTPRTASSEYQNKLIQEFATNCFVLNRGTDRLVPLVEAGMLDGERVDQILQEVLQPFIEAKIDTLVLGCTHFPFLKEPMQHILGDAVTILDSGEAIARQVEKLQKEQGMTPDLSAEHLFYTSGESDQMNRLLRTFDDFATLQAQSLV
ncbi:glutamate racemase [Patescibacteria group bacterium]|nr:glutamate racemase [Patescibacteria group bacterium]